MTANVDGSIIVDDNSRDTQAASDGSVQTGETKPDILLVFFFKFTAQLIWLTSYAS